MRLALVSIQHARGGRYTVPAVGPAAWGCPGSWSVSPGATWWATVEASSSRCTVALQFWPRSFFWQGRDPWAGYRLDAHTLTVCRLSLVCHSLCESSPWLLSAVKLSLGIIKIALVIVQKPSEARHGHRTRLYICIYIPTWPQQTCKNRIEAFSCQRIMQPQKTAVNQERSKSSAHTSLLLQGIINTSPNTILTALLGNVHEAQPLLHTTCP